MPRHINGNKGYMLAWTLKLYLNGLLIMFPPNLWPSLCSCNINNKNLKKKRGQKTRNMRKRINLHASLSVYWNDKFLVVLYCLYIFQTKSYTRFLHFKWHKILHAQVDQFKSDSISGSKRKVHNLTKIDGAELNLS